MFQLGLFLLVVNLAGVWSAQQQYPAGAGVAREGQWIQPAAGTFEYRWATPLGQAPVPLDDVLRMRLYVQRQDDGTLTAFIRNPEENLGAAIGTRSVVATNDSIELQAKDRKPITGRYDPASDTLTFRFEQAPGVFAFHREPPAAVTAYVYRVPAQGGDGWRTGSLQDAGIDEAAIRAIIDRVILPPPASLRAPYIQGVLIARHGKLVLDEYFNGFDAERPHDVRSASKSVTTLLVGLAIADSAAFTPESAVYTLLASDAPFQNFDARKKQMTVANLMSMQSGYACDDNDDNSPGNEDTMQSQTKQPDWYKYTLDLPMAADPGTKAVYCTAGINLLGAVISRSTKQWLPAYFAARFAQPMQFGRYGLWLMPQPVSDAYMGGGDLFRPRDFLKFGQLFLSGGSWNGTPVIDPAWLRLVATKRSTIEGEIGDYGWGWHLYEFDTGGRKIRAIGAGGNGGQLLFIFPQLDMTMMITAANYGQYPVWSGYIKTLVPEVLAAVRQ